MAAASASGCREHLPSVLEMAARRLAAAGVSTAVLDAQLLLAAAAGVDRSRLLSGSVAVSPNIIATFESLLVRRIAREPLAYIVGRREFYSLDFDVTRDVLIRR